MCPDYLTYVSSAPGCVDMLGVSRSSSGITKTKQSEVASIRKGNMQKLFEYTSEDVAAAKTVEDLKQICDRCRSAGVTWEGVWDGQTLNLPCIPTADGAKANIPGVAAPSCS